MSFVAMAMLLVLVGEAGGFKLDWRLDCNCGLVSKLSGPVAIGDVDGVRDFGVHETMD